MSPYTCWMSLARASVLSASSLHALTSCCAVSWTPNNVSLLAKSSSGRLIHYKYDVVSWVCRFILHAKKTAFIIEHDFIMATYLADRVIVFEGQPAIAATATPYVDMHCRSFPR